MCCDEQKTALSVPAQSFAWTGCILPHGAQSRRTLGARENAPRASRDNGARVRNPLFYFLIGTLVWLAFLKSGVHATIAALIMAFVIPARTATDPESFVRGVSEDLRAFDELPPSSSTRLHSAEREQQIESIARRVELVRASSRSAKASYARACPAPREARKSLAPRCAAAPTHRAHGRARAGQFALTPLAGVVFCGDPHAP